MSNFKSGKYFFYYLLNLLDPGEKSLKIVLCMKFSSHFDWIHHEHAHSLHLLKVTFFLQVFLVWMRVGVNKPMKNYETKSLSTKDTKSSCPASTLQA